MARARDRTHRFRASTDVDASTTQHCRACAAATRAGGKGLPFFATTLPAAKEPNGAIAKQAFSIHRTVGQAFEIMVLLHVGAVAQHHMRGQYIMNRMTSVFK